MSDGELARLEVLWDLDQAPLTVKAAEKLRRRQKMVEPVPAPHLPLETRTAPSNIRSRSP